MNLYVWDNPKRVLYGASMLVVAAESEEEARAQIRKGAAEYDWADTMSAADVENLGPADAVHEAPAAVYFSWCE